MRAPYRRRARDAGDAAPAVLWLPSTFERVLLFCAASGTDWLHAGVTGETVTAVVVKGLVERDTAGALALTDRGRAVLRAMLPDL
jgi:hypothetical protein